MKRLSRTEIPRHVRTLSNRELLRVTKEDVRISETGNGKEITYTLSDGARVRRFLPPDRRGIDRQKHILPPERFGKLMQLSRLAVAVHMIPNGANMVFRAARGTSPYKLSHGQLEACAAEAEELSQIVDNNGRALYVQTRRKDDFTTKADPVGLLYGIGIQVSKDSKLARPYLLLANESHTELGASAAEVRGTILFQEVMPFVEAPAS